MTIAVLSHLGHPTAHLRVAIDSKAIHREASSVSNSETQTSTGTQVWLTSDWTSIASRSEAHSQAAHSETNQIGR